MKEIEARAKPVTMEEMAKLAGVHSRTVRDALKGTGRVAPATREKVLRIARELKYVPNAAARALATGRTDTIAVLSGPLNESFYANMVHQLGNHLTANGYEMLLLPTKRSMEDLVMATQVAPIDGLIIIGISEFLDDFLRLSGGHLRPCVLIDIANPTSIDHITLQLRPAVEEVLQLMANAGCERIAYAINNRDENSHFEVRMAAYSEFMQARDKSREFIDVDTRLTPQERIATIKNWLQTHGCPGAIFGQNDETTIYVYRALMELGHRIPDDVLLAGCDGLPYMEFFEPPLSTIALPTARVCATAVEFLQRRIDYPMAPVQGAIVVSQLVTRKSLGADF